MIAATDILLSVVVFVAGFIGGRISKRTMLAKNAMPPCSCGHTRGTHTGGTGECQWSKWRTFAERREVCHCQVWDGPERPEDVIRGFQG